MKYHTQKKIYSILVFLVFCGLIVFVLTWQTERQAVTDISFTEVDLTQIAAKTELSKDDYDLLYHQTGLSQTDIDLIWTKEADITAVISRYQQRFLAKNTFDAEVLSWFSKAERIADRNQYYQIYDLKEGDVLLTKSTHTLFYRHGHSSLYLGGTEQSLLEATVIGSPVSLTTAAAWGGYPTGIQLRISEDAAAEIDMEPEELGAAVAIYAKEELLGDDYRLLAGAFGIGAENDGTQCAYLIYEAYAYFGLNVSSRDFPVTPSSLLESGKFDIIQAWGVDPDAPGW
jgi:hypothetical protein